MINAYLSHPIRGANPNPGPMDIENNLDRAKHVARILRAVFPDLDLYCPAEQDSFPQKAMELGLLSVDEVLNIDCEILSGMDVLLVFGSEDKLSEGMKAEVASAKYWHLPICYFETFSDLPRVGQFLKQFAKVVPSALSEEKFECPM